MPIRLESPRMILTMINHPIIRPAPQKMILTPISGLRYQTDSCLFFLPQSTQAPVQQRSASLVCSPDLEGECNESAFSQGHLAFPSNSIFSTFLIIIPTIPYCSALRTHCINTGIFDVASFLSLVNSKPSKCLLSSSVWQNDSLVVYRSQDLLLSQHQTRAHT